MATGQQPDSVAESLAAWRAAERDTAHAKTAASVAALGLASANSAEHAALTTERSALAAADAATKTKAAADQAKHAASQAAQAAQILSASAAADHVQAGQAIVDAERAEAAARDRFHAASGTSPRTVRGMPDARDSSDVVEGPVGSAKLREPTEVEATDAGADLDELPEVDRP
jgi:hypothetical protein